jgi:hypothetical protein
MTENDKEYREASQVIGMRKTQEILFIRTIFPDRRRYKREEQEYYEEVRQARKKNIELVDLVI